MPKRITGDALVLVAIAVGISCLGALVVRAAGKEMGTTVAGTVVLGLAVAGASHALMSQTNT